MEFTHKDIKIELSTSSGEFTATVGGKYIRKPSLDAMKKFIDDSKKKTFEPFDALDHDGEKVRVTGIQKPRANARYGRDGAEWICERREKKESWRNGTYTRHKIAIDNAENRAACKAHNDFNDETRKIEEKRRKDRDALAAKVVYIDPDDYKAPKE